MGTVAPDVKPPPLRVGFPNGVVAAVSAFAVFCAILNNFLLFNNYPLFRPEVALVVLAGGGLASGYGAAYHLLGCFRHGWAVAARTLFDVALLSYALSFIIDGILQVLAMALAVGALAFATRRSALPFIAVMALAMALAARLGIGQEREPPFRTVVRAASPADAPVSSQPAIVHILLDEHIGIEGLPGGNPGTPDLKRELRSFYVRHRFRLFGRAFSQHLNTLYSVPYIMSMGTDSSLEPSENRTEKSHLDYFDLLSKLGMKIKFIQSSYLDYCSTKNYSSCTTYNFGNAAYIIDSELSVYDKALLIFIKQIPGTAFLVQAYLQDTLTRRGMHWPGILDDNRGASALSGLWAMRQLTHQLAKAEPGNVYFAHILLPHGPYITRPDCSLKPLVAWRRMHVSFFTPETQYAYADQLRCTLRLVEAAIQAVSASPAGSNFIMIVHGDHGSRLANVYPLEGNLSRLRARDLLAGFSTLFAVRGPGLEPGYDERPFRVADLLHELTASGFASVGEWPQSRPEVFLAPRQELPPRRRIRLPASWYPDRAVR